MAKGAPDYTRPVEIRGFDGTTLQTLKVDTDGQLYAILRGIYGTTFKNVAVDDKGQLYVILRGASGNDVAVDADGALKAVFYGVDENNYPHILRTDAYGRLMAILNAYYDDTLKAVKCDASGNLYLNIGAQELAYLVSKGFVGNMHTVDDTWTPSASGQTHTVLSVSSGKGLLLICHMQPYSYDDTLRITIDGNILVNSSTNDLNNLQCHEDARCVAYTNQNREFVSLKEPIYYESSLLVQVISAAAGDINTTVTYSLV